MTDPKSMPDLEAALLDRAKKLADEYLARGKDSHAAILNEERERLRNREERITDEAKADADRLYRRRVQAAELRIHSMLDRERWNLIELVMDELAVRFERVAANRAAYEPLLQELLYKAADSIGEDELIASFNAADHKMLAGRWEEFVESAAPGKEIELDPEPIDCAGGIFVTNKDNRVAVDATFEGRCERFRDELVRVIAERLFAHAGVQVKNHG